MQYLHIERFIRKEWPDPLAGKAAQMIIQNDANTIISEVLKYMRSKLRTSVEQSANGVKVQEVKLIHEYGSISRINCSLG